MVLEKCFFISCVTYLFFIVHVIQYTMNYKQLAIRCSIKYFLLDKCFDNIIDIDLYLQ